MPRKVQLPTEVVLLRVRRRKFGIKQIQVAADIRRFASLFESTERIRQVGRLHHELHTAGRRETHLRVSDREDISELQSVGSSQHTPSIAKAIGYSKCRRDIVAITVVWNRVYPVNLEGASAIS